MPLPELLTFQHELARLIALEKKCQGAPVGPTYMARRVRQRNDQYRKCVRLSTNCLDNGVRILAAALNHNTAMAGEILGGACPDWRLRSITEEANKAINQAVL